MKATVLDLRFHAYFVSEDDAEEIATSLAETMRVMYQMEKAVLNGF